MTVKMLPLPGALAAVGLAFIIVGVVCGAP
jgi:hypothetical protein